MDNTNDRPESRFFDGDEHELSELKKKQSIQRFMRRKRNRKRIARIMYVLLFTAVITVFVILCLNFFFRVENIELTGTSRYSREDIISLTSISEGMSIFSASNRSLSGVNERLAYIKEFRVIRKFPDTVVIEALEDTPRYYAELYGEYFILSDELRILERTFEEPKREDNALIELLLPQINSALVGRTIEFPTDVSQRYVTAYIDALEASPMYERANAFDLRDRFNLALIASDIYIVKLGNGDELGTKLTAVAGMLGHAVMSDGIPASIDATNPTQCPVIKNPDLIVEFDD